MARTATANEGRRSTRPRQSVDYTAVKAPETPNWLKTGNKQHMSQDDQQGVNKENDRPASTAKKGRPSNVMPAVKSDIPDKKNAKDKPEAKASRSHRDSRQKEDATKGAVGAKAETKAAVTAAATTKADKHISKQRKSAPASAEEKAGKSSLVAKPAGKRSLPEQKREGVPGGTKKAKTSQPKGEAAQAADMTEKTAKSAMPAEKGPKSTDSWSSGDDMHPSVEAQSAQEPATVKSKRARTMAQGEEPAGKKEAPQQLPAEQKPSKKHGSTGSSDKAAKEAAAKHKLAEGIAAESKAKESAATSEAAAERASAEGLTAEGKAKEAAAKGKLPAIAEEDASMRDEAGPSASSDLQKLQAEYALLQRKYQAIKQQRMEELEALMTEQQQRALEHREAALKLAEHWKEEAIKQAKFAQEAGSAQFQKHRKALQEENRKLRQQLLDAQAAVLQQQALAADLQHLLAMAERRIDTPAKSQATPCIGNNAASPINLQSQTGASNTPSCISAIRDAYKSGTKAPTSSARPARTHTAVHLQEAHAMCPEGNELSETYHKPAHIPGASAGPGPDAVPSPAGNAGLQMGLNAASPLVQYSEDASVYQPRSRFAAEAALPADVPVLDISANVPGLDTAVNAPILDPGLDVPVWAAAGQEDVPMEVDGQLRHEKGVSAPAIMTTHSWPELVREVQQLPGPVGEAAQEMLQEGSVAGGQGSTLTQKALDTLVGLRAEPAEHGGYKYTHRSTGYTFEIRPVEAHSVAEDEMILPGEQELVFVPLSIGHAAEVLPDYLREEINFTPAQKQKLVGRIMEALGNFSLRQAARDQ